MSLRPPPAFCAISSGLPPLWGEKDYWRRAGRRAKANGYQRGARREETSRRDRNKHGAGTKDQDRALDRYVL
jgi:hypothetical protein